MKANALYFPHIIVPNNTWTTMAVLYWDKLATILPRDYMYAPEQLGEHMQALLAEGLVEPVIPGYYLHQVRDFDKAFMALVEQRMAGIKRSRIPPADLINTVSIHAEKMGDVPDFLVDAGLARRVNCSWYEVEQRIAYQFMAYLATCLGAIPEVNASAVTDKSMFTSFRRSKHEMGAHNTDMHAGKARKVILQSLLPIPQGQVDLGALVKFKQRHGQLLPALRAKIEGHCGLIASLPDATARAALTEVFTRECKQQIEEIESAMKPSFSNITFGSLVPLFAAGLAWRETDAGNPVAYAGAALAFGGAAYQAIASIRGNQKGLEHAPLAYVAKARLSLTAA